jgi:predicted hydrolase (HD superfamily)
MERQVTPELLARAQSMHEKYVRQNAVQTLTKSRADSVRLLETMVSSEALRKHMFTVEAAMIAYAGKFGEDAALWGATGLLHDVDYEKCQTVETHVFAAIPMLATEGYPAPMLDAIAGHADYLGISRETKLAKTLFAVDELCGFLTAVAYVRPTKTLEGIEFSSINKKLKDKPFARAVSRDDIRKGAEELGVDFQEHVMFVARALEPLLR